VCVGGGEGLGAKMFWYFKNSGPLGRKQVCVCVGVEMSCGFLSLISHRRRSFFQVIRLSERHSAPRG